MNTGRITFAPNPAPDAAPAITPQGGTMTVVAGVPNPLYPHADVTRLEKRIEGLEELVRTMASALREGYHSGFCNGTCPICDAYKAALSASSAFLSTRTPE